MTPCRARNASTELIPGIKNSDSFANAEVIVREHLYRNRQGRRERTGRILHRQ